MLLMPSQSLKNFLWPSSSKHNFTVPLKKHTSYCFWTIAPPNSYFSYFCKCAKCAKMPKDRTKLKTKARYKISTINLFKKVVKPLQKITLENSFFPKLQGWEFAHSLFALSLKIAHFKERPWAIRTHHSLQKSNVNDLLVLQANRSQRTSDSLEKFKFFLCFWQFFLFFMPKSKSLLSLLAHLLFF